MKDGKKTGKRPLADEPEMKELHRQIKAGKIDPKKVKKYIEGEENHDRDSGTVQS